MAYSDTNLKPEQEIYDGNQAIRDILRDKAELVPKDLQADAESLLTHYDAWFEEYDRLRGEVDKGEPPQAVYAGPAGHPFPRSAAESFQEAYCRYQFDVQDGLLQAQLDSIQIKQQPMEAATGASDGRRKVQLAFSVAAEGDEPGCILRSIDRVVYVLDDRWFTPNEFIRHDPRDNFSFRVTVWGSTSVLAKIYVPGNKPILREGFMNLNKETYFSADTVQRPQ